MGPSLYKSLSIDILLNRKELSRHSSLRLAFKRDVAALTALLVSSSGYAAIAKFILMKTASSERRQHRRNAAEFDIDYKKAPISASIFKFVAPAA
jgi:hypothetical protein